MYNRATLIAIPRIMPKLLCTLALRLVFQRTASRSGTLHNALPPEPIPPISAAGVPSEALRVLPEAGRVPPEAPSVLPEAPRVPPLPPWMLSEALQVLPEADQVLRKALAALTPISPIREARSDQAQAAGR